MRGRKGALLGLTSALVLIMILSSSNPAHAQPPSSSTPVSVTEQIQPLYDVYGGGVNTVLVVVSGSSSLLTSGTTFSVTTSFDPTLSPAPVNTTQVSATVKSQGGAYTDTFNVAGSSFQVSLSGPESGASFLWRYLAGSPSQFVTFTGIAVAPQYFVEVPSGTVLSQVYTAKGGNLPSNSASEISSGSGQVTYSVSGQVGLIIFQSTSFLPATIAITVAALALAALAALNFFATGRQLYDDISGRLRAGARTMSGALPYHGRRKGFRIRNLFQPKKLLVLFILCALVMVALGAVGGPDPRVKAYVVAGNQAATTAIQGQLQKVAPNLLVLTPTQDFTDFNVMSSVGQFNVIVFSNYTSAQIQEEGEYILGYLANVPIIVVDGTGNASVTTGIEALYPGQVLYVPNAQNMTSPETIALGNLLVQNQRSNILGLNLSNGEFKALLEFEAVLSMVLVLIGWAYLGSLASESYAERELSHLAAIIVAGVFVFFFSEAIYVVTSSTLAVPLSLHAVNSDAHDITAIGLLGFGGGSTPRLIAGVLGVFAGALGVEGGLRVKKADFALIGGLALVLLANPLTIGQYFYQGILLFFPLGSLAFGTAFSNSLTLKGFIYGFGVSLGGGVTPTYVLSAGKMLFFAGLIPLAYLKKMGRTTTIIALLMVALMIGDGGVRVGEMTPDKTVVAIVPGLIAGFAFAALILGLAALEKYVRGNWKSRA